MNLKIKKLNKQFGKFKAVKDVDLDIKKGEIFTILGESGSGKSTVLRMIVGFETPTSGTITFNDKIISDKDTFISPENRSVGLVFQDLALFPHMSVEDNILYGMHKGTDKSELHELISLCKLNGLEKRFPHQISGGEMQRVALARAIAGKPDIIMLDEPFNNLDILLKESILRDIKEIIKKRGITALFVTHHKDEAYYLSDRIAIMRGGKIMQVGNPHDVYKNPKCDYTASFLGKTNLLSKNGIDGWVRPEDIIIKRDEDSDAEIKEISFQGHFIEVKLKLLKSDYTQENIYAYTQKDYFKVGDRVSANFEWRSF